MKTHDSELRKFCLAQTVPMQIPAAEKLEAAETFYRWIKEGKGEVARAEKIERTARLLVDAAFPVPLGNATHAMITPGLVQELKNLLEAE